MLVSGPSHSSATVSPPSMSAVEDAVLEALDRWADEKATTRPSALIASARHTGCRVMDGPELADAARPRRARRPERRAGRPTPSMHRDATAEAAERDLLRGIRREARRQIDLLAAVRRDENPMADLVATGIPQKRDPAAVWGQGAEKASRRFMRELRQLTSQRVPAMNLGHSRSGSDHHADVGRVDRHLAEQDGRSAKPLLPRVALIGSLIGRHGRHRGSSQHAWLGHHGAATSWMRGVARRVRRTVGCGP